MNIQDLDYQVQRLIKMKSSEENKAIEYAREVKEVQQTMIDLRHQNNMLKKTYCKMAKAIQASLKED